ncbi:MAG: hypothetical protein U5O39_03680 [Gammaproteobacteria bacterium]|nr:hypothetical protein [Gammaproteobacteria bacterium]
MVYRSLLVVIAALTLPAGADDSAMAPASRYCVPEGEQPASRRSRPGMPGAIVTSCRPAIRTRRKTKG